MHTSQQAFKSGSRTRFLLPPEFALWTTISSAESQKGINVVQQCSVDNQNLERYSHRLYTAIAPFWFSTEHLCYTDIDHDWSWNITFRWTAKRVIFSQGIIIFLKCAALRENIVPRENITILAPPTHDISSGPVDIYYIIRWSKWMIFI